LIYNAGLANAFAILTHPFALILTDFGILLISPVRLTPLLASASVPAFVVAVGLTSVARPTDEKHQPATDGSAK
jgi:hypothetical protein